MNGYSKDEVERVLLNIESQRFKENLNNETCLYKNCTHKPIDSHIIQRALLGETLAEDNNVYVWMPQNVARGISQGKEVFFEKTSINRSGVFKGFCGDKGDSHDAKLFRGIETDVKSTSIEEYVFLYSYRSLIYHLWLEKGLTLSQADKVSKMLSNPVITELSAKINDIPTETRTLLSIDDELPRFENLKKVYEKYIDSEGKIGNFSDGFFVKFLPLDRITIDFATLGTKVYNSEYPITLGVLPKYKDMPNLFFIVAHKDDETNVLIENLKQITLDNISQYCWLIQNLPMKWSTNSFLSPKLYDHLTLSGELSQLQNFIASTELLDFNDYQNFNLINVFK
ncbi:hypothetical protein [Streptococcus equi]|uniref:Uncharacterized protein n=1 Tax=Streptococcus equi subsp. zooepidemicus (strain MGCS10565) TaxID=552526 RepID=B4U0Z7_STREM|nr:hypothetical protein [Streptococcus equi]ACG61684.1 hypothetical protein Sez_0308 [Streptococcus equi subsp. zooepidemicus MGCS10565]MCD3384859.1 hypothetical protein [Streptococcus equi subsp. zooepidemicus]MCD3393237.1 hypothetical protein [Streptococcus equi subsp. zooepidemicus]MCD3428960.1 hypothetical protein [Streptococcus equi subsp. zooepidemicus]MDI6035352.1 hypothetical protein [Streptococcus equi subsp. zooepidemicus]